MKAKNSIQQVKKRVKFNPPPKVEARNNLNQNRDKTIIDPSSGLIKFRTLKTKHLWSAETSEKIEQGREHIPQISTAVKTKLKIKNARGRFVGKDL